MQICVYAVTCVRVCANDNSVGHGGVDDDAGGALGCVRVMIVIVAGMILIVMILI